MCKRDPILQLNSTRIQTYNTVFLIANNLTVAYNNKTIDSMH